MRHEEARPHSPFSAVSMVSPDAASQVTTLIILGTLVFFIFGDLARGAGDTWTCSGPEKKFLSKTWAVTKGFSYAQKLVHERGFASFYMNPITDAYRAGHAAAAATFADKCRKQGTRWTCKDPDTLFHLVDALNASAVYNQPRQDGVTPGLFQAEAFKQAFKDFHHQLRQDCTMIEAARAESRQSSAPKKVTAADAALSGYPLPIKHESGVGCFSRPGAGSYSKVIRCKHPWTEYRGPKTSGYPERVWFCRVPITKNTVPMEKVHAWLSDTGQCSMFGNEDPPEGWRAVAAAPRPRRVPKPKPSRQSPFVPARVLSVYDGDTVKVEAAMWPGLTW